MVTILKDGFVVEVHSTTPLEDWGYCIHATATLFGIVAAYDTHIDDATRGNVGNLTLLLIALANIDPKSWYTPDITIEEYMKTRFNSNPQSHDNTHQG